VHTGPAPKDYATDFFFCLEDFIEISSIQTEINRVLRECPRVSRISASSYTHVSLSLASNILKISINTTNIYVHNTSDETITAPNVSDPVDEIIQEKNIPDIISARCIKLIIKHGSYMTDGNVRFASACSIQFYLTKILMHSLFNALDRVKGALRSVCKIRFFLRKENRNKNF